MGFVLVTPDNGQIETVSAPAEGGRHGDALTQVGVAAKSGQRPSSVQNANARVGNIGNFITDLPPHLALPDFFGPDPQDPEVILQREQAAEDFLDSLKGNISEEDIALMTEAVEAALAAEEMIYPQTVGPHDEVFIPDEVEQAEELAQTLRDAGIPEDAIEEMLSHLLSPKLEDLEEVTTPEEEMLREENKVLP